MEYIRLVVYINDIILKKFKPTQKNSNYLIEIQERRRRCLEERVKGSQEYLDLRFSVDQSSQKSSGAMLAVLLKSYIFPLSGVTSSGIGPSARYGFSFPW